MASTEATPGVLVSVVDDDESVRESLPDLLRELGFSALTYSSADEFLQTAQIEQTQCLILDIHMPEMSGPELNNELRRRGHRIPVIFITAHGDAASRPEVADGAVACLVKPFSDTALQEALWRALGM